ncbi:MAG: ATP-dependent DNA helicase RecQ [Oscillospiraceae bacterium]|nr:ATP-dependent DNA helicase RecQ [Oscillospiraceae bacterium]
MSNRIIANCIKEKLAELHIGSDAIVVLKGIPLSIVDNSIERIDLADVISNKFRYFMSIFERRQYLSYEEFLLFSNFVVDQYKEIYILNNNIYMEQYPIEECFDDNVRAGLLNHYAESEEGETDSSYIGDIDEYISIFQGLKEYNGYLMGVYCPVLALQSQKVITVNLFENNHADLLYSAEQPDDFVDIIEEADYIDMVKLMLTEPNEIHIRISNYTGDINKLKDHIAIIAHYWKGYTEISFIKAQELDGEYVHRDEYGEILQKYWGYSSFRNLSVYEMNSIEQGEKVVKQVSQESIIANLVEEVENCGEGKHFRDVFVTAPTGAGKSVMFQIPAIYLAEKYNLLTIVISPLIGLMNDQVKNLELKNYSSAKTINSDISPIIKQDIIEKVSEGQYHILYISPETLLSRSDVEQLIGDRTIGMIIIDEAHIVTTWGKQFRPDYWYLGDHIRKLRKRQMTTKGRSFVIGTFTATAIYRGIEDMYTETINSLHMLSPITYLGYIKREDIDIVINNPQKHKEGRTEYELDKFNQIEDILHRAIITNKKTLIYFPTVALIIRCYEYLRDKREVERVAVYHGSLSKDEKQENYEKFLAKEKLVMLATKAFGMGIDINDIELVVHFAPTGNVCDYVQEIGRAARREDLRGEALYNYNSRDFKHINRLHGLSTIQKYQLIKVIEKIDELYHQNLRNEKNRDLTKKRNAMLLDAENFTYIFGSPISDEDSNVNKVKTALLLIQKDFEANIGFSPITVRPIPMFSIGFFEIEPSVQQRILQRYPHSIEEIESNKHICRVILSTIWDKDYKNQSFPKFKYLLYTKDHENLDFVLKYPMTPALCVNVSYSDDYSSSFRNIWNAFKGFIGKKIISSEFTAVSEIVDELSATCGLNKYKAHTICEVVIASIDSYRKNFARTSTSIVSERATNDGKIKYQFNVAVNSYFQWVEAGLRKIENETHEGKLYIINDNGKQAREYSVILGILESMSILTFEMIGGANSQLYIYINQIRALKNIINAPYNYKNRLLESVAERHLISVKMLTYFYEGDFSNEDRWDLLENYFLGVIPEKVKLDCKRERPDMSFT